MSITIYVVLGFYQSFGEIVGCYENYNMALEFIEQHKKKNERRKEQDKSCIIYDEYAVESHYLVKGEQP